MFICASIFIRLVYKWCGFWAFGPLVASRSYFYIPMQRTAIFYGFHGTETVLLANCPLVQSAMFLVRIAMFNQPGQIHRHHVLNQRSRTNSLTKYIQRSGCVRSMITSPNPLLRSSPGRTSNASICNLLLCVGQGWGLTVTKYIRHAELTIEHANNHSKLVTKPDEARRSPWRAKRCIEVFSDCWHAQLSKEILYNGAWHSPKQTSKQSCSGEDTAGVRSIMPSVTSFSTWSHPHT